MHIADVSFFVKPNTALDRDARKRATSVYLVQRAVPMLPPTLSEQLCSLRAGEERLAFSVIFTMTEDGRVLKKWFGKTVIKSCGQLAYKHAQNVIDGKSLGDAPVIPDCAPQDIEHDIRLLANLARQMRAHRFEEGCLSLSSTRLHFDLGEDGMPIDCAPYDATEANHLVEEVSSILYVLLSRELTFLCTVHVAR